MSVQSRIAICTHYIQVLMQTSYSKKKVDVGMTYCNTFTNSLSPTCTEISVLDLLCIASYTESHTYPKSPVKYFKS